MPWFHMATDIPVAPRPASGPAIAVPAPTTVGVAVTTGPTPHRRISYVEEALPVLSADDLACAEISMVAWKKSPYIPAKAPKPPVSGIDPSLPSFCASPAGDLRASNIASPIARRSTTMDHSPIRPPRLSHSASHFRLSDIGDSRPQSAFGQLPKFSARTSIRHPRNSDVTTTTTDQDDTESVASRMSWLSSLAPDVEDGLKRLPAQNPSSARASASALWRRVTPDLSPNSPPSGSTLPGQFEDSVPSERLSVGNWMHRSFSRKTSEIAKFPAAMRTSVISDEELRKGRGSSISEMPRAMVIAGGLSPFFLPASPISSARTSLSSNPRALLSTTPSKLSVCPPPNFSRLMSHQHLEILEDDYEHRSSLSISVSSRAPSSTQLGGLSPAQPSLSQPRGPAPAFPLRPNQL